MHILRPTLCTIFFALFFNFYISGVRSYHDNINNLKKLVRDINNGFLEGNAAIKIDGGERFEFKNLKDLVKKYDISWRFYRKSKKNSEYKISLKKIPNFCHRPKDSLREDFKFFPHNLDKKICIKALKRIILEQREEEQNCKDKFILDLKNIDKEKLGYVNILKEFHLNINQIFKIYNLDQSFLRHFIHKETAYDNTLVKRFKDLLSVNSLYTLLNVYYVRSIQEKNILEINKKLLADIVTYEKIKEILSSLVDPQGEAFSKKVKDPEAFEKKMLLKNDYSYPYAPAESGQVSKGKNKNNQQKNKKKNSIFNVKKKVSKKRNSNKTKNYYNYDENYKNLLEKINLESASNAQGIWHLFTEQDILDLYCITNNFFKKKIRELFLSENIEDKNELKSLKSVPQFNNIIVKLQKQQGSFLEEQEELNNITEEKSIQSDDRESNKSDNEESSFFSSSRESSVRNMKEAKRDNEDYYRI